MDTGTRYERKESNYIAELTEVGYGTPMGELLRRYWHPVALSAEANATPRRVRALGEDLVLFRDGTGRAGLMHARCAHRGTTLYYGKVEESGIRCCYHGWLYDVEGHCLDQPAEPEGGRLRDMVRQPWYPVEERYGLVFAYLGPPAKKPVLPRYDILERGIDPARFTAARMSFATGGPPVVPCNWLQYYENIADVFHVPILHGGFSGLQFAAVMAKLPKVEWLPTGHGIKIVTKRAQDDGSVFERVTEAYYPTARGIPDPFGSLGETHTIGWALPIDDTHFTVFHVGHAPAPGEPILKRSLHNGKHYDEMSEAEHRDFPDDWEAQTGQGPITLHSEEHLATSDQGIVMMRRLFLKQVEAVALGKDPIGVAFTEAEATVPVIAGNFARSLSEAAE